MSLSQSFGQFFTTSLPFSCMLHPFLRHEGMQRGTRIFGQVLFYLPAENDKPSSCEKLYQTLPPFLPPTLRFLPQGLSHFQWKPSLELINCLEKSRFNQPPAGSRVLAAQPAEDFSNRSQKATIRVTGVILELYENVLVAAGESGHRVPYGSVAAVVAVAVAAVAIVVVVALVVAVVVASHR